MFRRVTIFGWFAFYGVRAHEFGGALRTSGRPADTANFTRLHDYLTTSDRSNAGFLRLDMGHGFHVMLGDTSFHSQPLTLAPAPGPPVPILNGAFRSSV